MHGEIRMDLRQNLREHCDRSAPYNGCCTRGTHHIRPNRKETGKTNFAILIQGFEFFVSGTTLNNSGGHYRKQHEFVSLQCLTEKNHGIKFANILFHSYSSSFFSSWGLVVIMR